ncbi:MAG TPA: hypothetical protein VFO36_03810, partial [Nitrospiraceae bacterium]|nr:hypothetical protein [Nitrospiraceae bacterium]
LTTVLLAWRPLLEILWQRGPGVVRRIEWTEQGEWRLGIANRDLSLAILLNESAVLGPLVFLVWSHEGRKRFALIDSTCCDSHVFRTLRARMQLDA